MCKMFKYIMILEKTKTIKNACFYKQDTTCVFKLDKHKFQLSLTFFTTYTGVHDLKKKQ